MKNIVKVDIWKTNWSPYGWKLKIDGDNIWRKRKIGNRTHYESQFLTKVGVMREVKKRLKGYRKTKEIESSFTNGQCFIYERER